MIRTFLAAVALATLIRGAGAGEAVVRLNVRPMPAPKPALKYQLLPELEELNPGNAAQNYLKCFAEQRNFFFSKEATTERARYLSTPLAELPAEKLRHYGGFALRQADWAARLDNPGWELLRHVQNGGMDLRPELGRLQLLGPALLVRFRAEVAGRHFNDAVRTAKTMFALARHLGEYPREAANLVGVSVADLALGALEEMVQQPGCPNLYWALTNLPCPLVDLHKGVQGDRALTTAELRLLRDDTPMSAEELEKVVSHLSGVLGLARIQTGQPPRSLRATLAAEVANSDRIRATRARLMEARSVQDLVQRVFLVSRFPPLQVILLEEKHAFEVRRDEAMKLLALAPWQIDAFADSEERTRSADAMFADFLPDVLSARRTQGRLEQRIALLRHVEALRLYAAENGDKLAEKLTEVPVPLPPDPFTGKPFVYRVEAETAHLCGCPPRGEEQNPCYNVRYEVTIPTRMR